VTTLRTVRPGSMGVHQCEQEKIKVISRWARDEARKEGKTLREKDVEGKAGKPGGLGQ